MDLVHSEARHAISLHQGQPVQALGVAVAELTQACNTSVPALTIWGPRTTNEGHSKGKSYQREINRPVILYRERPAEY